MRLRAKVVRVTGRTRHHIGTVVDGLPLPLREIPPPTLVEILEEESSYLLLGCDESGASLCDSWFASVEEAKRQANFEYDVAEESWVEVD